jgi:hypothetical protein
MFAVMSVPELARTTDPLWRAAQANELMWTKHPDRAGLRSLRARSIQEALASGHTAQAVAGRLGVAVSDLNWMARDVPAWPYRNGRPNGAAPEPAAPAADELPAETAAETAAETDRDRPKHAS